MRGLHIAEDILEEYAFERLGGQELDDVDDHLLVCEFCQTRLAEVESYAREVKLAAAWERGDRQAEKESAWRGWLRGWAAPARSLAPAGAVMSLAMVLLLPGLRESPPGYVDLSLESTRGSAIVQAQAGAYYRLHIPSAGLAAPAYRVWISDGSGKKRWEGPALPEAPDRLLANVAVKLNAGSYWAHVGPADREPEVLRQFEFQVTEPR
jgi:hypothetical protein